MGAGNGKREINVIKSNYSDFLKKLPNDQYVCSECGEVPEIIKVDFNKYLIEFNCKEHKTKNIPIKKYIDLQSKFLYCNYICDKDKTKQIDCLENVFSYCFQCHQKFCTNCLKKDAPTHKKYNFPINETSSICKKHFLYFNKFCKDCYEHKCKNCEITDKSHNIIKIANADKKDIELLNNHRKSLMEKKENIEYLIKLIDMILVTYKNHSYNYFHKINISNIAKSIKDYESININLEGQIKNIKNKVLEYLNSKLKIDLKGDEKDLNLSNKNIEVNDFKLFSLLDFPNIESINLSYNQLTDTNVLNNFNLQQIKIIDLSNNNIQDLSFLKEAYENDMKLEKLFLNNNKIKNADIFKKKKFKFLKELQLEGNLLSEKEICEINKNIHNENYSNIFTFFYCIDEEEFINENKIRIFGDIFVNNNKNNCKIIINDKETELTNFYFYKKGEKEINVKFLKTGNITNMSSIFARCVSLTSLPDISKWDTSNVDNMSCMFLNCKKLVEIDDISIWDTSNVTNMQSMFCNCLSLSNLPKIEKWNTNKVENFNFMFDGCKTAIIPDKYYNMD